MGDLREAGLLPVETSFAERRLSLGYRRIRLRDAGPLGAPGATFRGHEFHYAKEGAAEAVGDVTPLFDAGDAKGEGLAPAGLRHDRVCGSFLHLIDRARA